jgi:hypothetical protein
MSVDKKTAQTTTAEDADNKKSVTDFLQVPRKKRKHYIVTFYSDGFDPNLSATFGSFFRTNYKHLHVLNVSSVGELRRNFNKIISLMVIDDEAAPLDEIMGAVYDLKVKRKGENIPVAFMTRNPRDLIEEYHQKLLPFHEVDDYLSYQKSTSQEMIGRIRKIVELTNRRKSRRFAISLPIKMFHLEANKMIDATITDLSIHGAKVCGQQDFTFREGDQLKLHLPVTGYLDYSEGDFMRVSAKVRRVMMSGRDVAVSFEHFSDHQFQRMTQFVSGIARQQVSVQQQNSRGRPEPD